MNPKRFFNERGMTLVEVVVVIAVAGILAAVALPTISTALQREKSRGFAHEVANTLREARNQAMSRGESLRVWIDYDTGGEDPGLIKVWRMNKLTPAGNYGSGDDCSLDPYSCPEGEVCMDGACQGAPPRTCREVPVNSSTGDDFFGVSTRYTLVNRENFGEDRGGDVTIRFAQGSDGYFLCMSPDGSIQERGGGLIKPWSTFYQCPEEGLSIWIGDRQATLGDVIVGMRCGGGPEEYDRVRGHVVRVMSNGEISFRPPRRQ